MSNYKLLLTTLVGVVFIISFTLMGFANTTTVPGHAKRCDKDGNGFL
jgi:hypothetical protein